MASIIKFIGDEKNVIIPRKIDGYEVKRIGISAFTASDIESVTIPDTVEDIWDRAFQYCKSLHTVKIKSKKLKIWDEAFDGCKKLKNINLPSGLTMIGVQAFFGCESLEKIFIPNTVYDWGPEAFCATSISELEFEDGIEAIGDYACFWSLDGKLESVTIPASVKKIGEYSFDNHLKEAVFLGDAPRVMGNMGIYTDTVIRYKEGTSGWDSNTYKDYKLIPYN